MKQDGYQVTSDIIAKTQPDTANTMRLTSDEPRMEPVENNTMTKMTPKTELPFKNEEKFKDISKIIQKQ